MLAQHSQRGASDADLLLEYSDRGLVLGIGLRGGPQFAWRQIQTKKKAGLQGISRTDDDRDDRLGVLDIALGLHQFLLRGRQASLGGGESLRLGLNVAAD